MTNEDIRNKTTLIYLPLNIDPPPPKYRSKLEAKNGIRRLERAYKIATARGLTVQSDDLRDALISASYAAKEYDVRSAMVALLETQRRLARAENRLRLLRNRDQSNT